mmetsp:Transcript_4336/g.5838  ORF Transcript_4336/g.5838 Transcript_4336/m.5838 type:complete len:200 (+) Transcript_4336:1392-1991(+)
MTFPSRFAFASAAAFLAAANARSKGVSPSVVLLVLEEAPYPLDFISSDIFFNFSASFFLRSSNLAYKNLILRSFFFCISSLSYGSPHSSSIRFSASSRRFMLCSQMTRFFLARSRLICISILSGLTGMSYTSSKVAYGLPLSIFTPLGGPPTLSTSFANRAASSSSPNVVALRSASLMANHGSAARRSLSFLRPLTYPS